MPEPRSTPRLPAGGVCQLHLTVLPRLLAQTVLKSMAETPRVTSPPLSSAEWHDNFSWAGACLGAMARQEKNLFLLQRDPKIFGISQCQSVWLPSIWLMPMSQHSWHMAVQEGKPRFCPEGKLDSCWKVFQSGSQERYPPVLPNIKVFSSFPVHNPTASAVWAHHTWAAVIPQGAEAFMDWVMYFRYSECPDPI